MHQSVINVKQVFDKQMRARGGRLVTARAQRKYELFWQWKLSPVSWSCIAEELRKSD